MASDESPPDPQGTPSISYSMWSSAREIAAGDVVIVWLTREALQPLIVTPGRDFNSKFGNYRHSDFVGVPYGSQVRSRDGKGFIHLLRPSPELWTIALPHRTQILYLADIAFITSWLDIKPGSFVIEAAIRLIFFHTGTGSGSFSHSVARSIGPTGHLWSYEFHEARAHKASEEFARHGLTDTITLTHRNVCKDGFTIVNTADSVFLDLPAPWEVVGNAKVALRKDRTTRICCFSPCMEQVLRTVAALNDAGFTEITMYETLLRPLEVESIPALQPIGEVSDRLMKSEQRREEKRQMQIAGSRYPKSFSENAGGKRKREGTPIAEIEVGREESDSKKISATPLAPELTDMGEPSTVPRDPHEGLVNVATLSSAPNPVSTKMVVSKGMPDVRGHTSYLTFACLIPDPGALT